MMEDNLNPLITEGGKKFLNEMLQNSAAPIFNHAAGDRIEKVDLGALDILRQKLSAGKVPQSLEGELFARVEKWIATVPLYRQTMGYEKNLKKNWHTLPTVSRQNIAEHPELLVPDDEDLKRLIVYRTAGTTGHPLLVPHHPRAAAAYQILIEGALKTCGIKTKFEEGRVACFLIGAQRKTVTYPTVLSVWNQAGFAKLNINLEDWRAPHHREEYFHAFSPEILTGDPISFAALADLKINIKPKALISTAVAMSASLKLRLEQRFGAPVIDWYSLTETGPLGFVKPGEEGYSLLSPDVLVEVLDEKGLPVPPGKLGEIVVTGGRNPYVPLIRYRTGDYGCRVGDKLMHLEGRKPVVFRSVGKRSINTVDIARVLREYPIVQHHFKQNADLSCDVTLRLFTDDRPLKIEKLRQELTELFEGAKVQIEIDPELGDRTSGKTIAYVSELKYEE